MAHTLSACVQLERSPSGAVALGPSQKRSVSSLDCTHTRPTAAGSPNASEHLRDSLVYNIGRLSYRQLNSSSGAILSHSRMTHEVDDDDDDEDEEDGEKHAWAPRGPLEC